MARSRIPTVDHAIGSARLIGLQLWKQQKDPSTFHLSQAFVSTASQDHHPFHSGRFLVAFTELGLLFYLRQGRRPTCALAALDAARMSLSICESCKECHQIMPHLKYSAAHFLDSADRKSGVGRVIPRFYGSCKPHIARTRIGCVDETV
jgi:hypothetical protein